LLNFVFRCIIFWNIKLPGIRIIGDVSEYLQYRGGLNMKAAVWNGPNDLQIQNVPRPDPSENEVLIETRAVGVCGTDLEIFRGRFKHIVPPLIIGHEGGGIVRETGRGVSSLKKGDRVIVECILYCGTCCYCRHGDFGLCDDGKVIGISGAQGEYAEYFTAPEKNCHILPQNIAWPEACMVDSLADTVHGFEKVSMPLLGTVAVFGPGPGGLFFCALAKMRGASKVYLIGTRDNRLRLGPLYGADLTININNDNAVEIILSDTEGRGVDVVIEAAGSEKALKDGMSILKKGGTLQIYGVHGTEVPVDLEMIQLHEFNVLGSAGSDYTTAVRLVESGAVNVKELISHRFSIEDLPRAFSSGLIEKREDNYMKGVVLF
jgi:L-iditol 2-dehydrogenase